MSYNVVTKDQAQAILNAGCDTKSTSTAAPGACTSSSNKKKGTPKKIKAIFLSGTTKTSIEGILKESEKVVVSITRENITTGSLIQIYSGEETSFVYSKDEKAQLPISENDLIHVELGITEVELYIHFKD